MAMTDGKELKPVDLWRDVFVSGMNCSNVVKACGDYRAGGQRRPTRRIRPHARSSRPGRPTRPRAVADYARVLAGQADVAG